MAETDRAIVVGAGVGGLSAAAALRQAGFEAVVYERAPELLDVGCVQLWTNGMVALDELGVADTIYERGLELHTQEFRSARGRVMFSAAVADIARQHGTLPPANIRRLDLIKTVFEALDPGVVQFGTACTSFEQDAEGVTVRLADGREERCGVLIGADGIGSSIRGQLFGGPEPRDSGTEVMRTLIPFNHPSLPPGKFSLTFGKGDRFGLVHTSQEVLCWFAIYVTGSKGAVYGEEERLSPGGGKDPPGARMQLLRERYGDFPEPISEVLERTPEETIYRAEIRDIVPIDRWTVGRVTLLGDAAHAATPYLGRGAGEAVEDAVTLAQKLREAGSLSAQAVEGALQAYEAERRPPTARTQNTAWRFGRFAGNQNVVVTVLREKLMGSVGRRVITRAIHTEFGELGKRARREATPSATT